MTWTPERIAAAKSVVDFAAGCKPAYAEVRITGDEFQELVALARLGLFVVAPTEADVERVFCVLAWGQPERPVELANDDQMARAMAGNPALLARARAVFAVMTDTQEKSDV